MKKAFTKIEVFTKPHVAYFLKHHFGNPCMIPSGHFISEFLRISLSNPIKRNEARIVSLKTPVQITLSESDITRYGSSLTKTNELNFSNAVDSYIRSQIRSLTESILYNHSINEDWMRRFVELQKEHKAVLQHLKSTFTESTVKKSRTFESRMNKRIAEFETYKLNVNHALMMAAYDALGFDESILPLETIKKDFYRYKKRQNP